MAGLAYPAAAFLGSFLLFVLEFMTAKMLLPYFGGGAYVWGTCLMFFQGLLLLGYAYGRLTEAASPRWFAALHLALLAAALAGCVPSVALRPVEDVFLRLLSGLWSACGLPLLVLSATTPVMQDCWRRSPRGRQRDPAFLFAWSNAGAFAALFAYPLAWEPNLSLTAQGRLFAGGLGFYALLCGACLVANRGRSGAEARAEPAPAAWRESGLWLLLALGPNAALLCAANLLSLDLASVPLVWMLPLAVYLLTLMLAFQSRPWMPERPGRLLILAGLGLAFGTWGIWELLGYSRDAWFVQRRFLLLAKAVFIHGVLFVLCWACHRALAESRPQARGLPRFYLWMATGGWLGGMLISIGMPVLGRAIASPNFEALLAVLACLAGLAWRDPGRGRVRRIAWGASIAAVLVWTAYAAGPAPGRLWSLRNFYGFYRVTEQDGVRMIHHGRTMHGMQYADPRRAARPLAYYHPHSPIGEVFAEFGPRARSLAVVGLGAGTCAAFGRPGQTMDFYELDPDMTDAARRFFTFLDRSPARVSVVNGDARVSLDRGGGTYGLILLDAFVGGAIPLHLLTQEAFRTYSRRLESDGVILVHITNRFLDLRPVLAAWARDQGWHAAAKRPAPEGSRAGFEYVSSCVALTRDPAKYKRLLALGWRDIACFASRRAWTDESSSVWSALR